MSKISVLFYGCLMVFCLHGQAQQKVQTPDLSNQTNLQAINREATLLTDNRGKNSVQLNTKPGPGVVWIKDVVFKTGTIEFDVKGKDKLQQSFVGIAFHGQNDSTYESIYFRPFNFQAADPVRKSHSVQYIALPKFDWYYLRETFPDTYEHPLLTSVDPNRWFHVRVSVTHEAIQVFVNTDTQPCLVVKPLVPHKSGKVGFWVGNNSEGDFAGLVLKSH
jgi:hypothetical protein